MVGHLPVRSLDRLHVERDHHLAPPRRLEAAADGGAEAGAGPPVDLAHRVAGLERTDAAVQGGVSME